MRKPPAILAAIVALVFVFTSSVLILGSPLPVYAEENQGGTGETLESEGIFVGETGAVEGNSGDQEESLFGEAEVSGGDIGTTGEDAEDDSSTDEDTTADSAVNDPVTDSGSGDEIGETGDNGETGEDPAVDCSDQTGEECGGGEGDCSGDCDDDCHDIGEESGSSDGCGDDEGGCGDDEGGCGDDEGGCGDDEGGCGGGCGDDEGGCGGDEGGCGGGGKGKNLPWVYLEWAIGDGTCHAVVNEETDILGTVFRTRPKECFESTSCWIEVSRILDGGAEEAGAGDFSLSVGGAVSPDDGDAYLLQVPRVGMDEWRLFLTFERPGDYNVEVSAEGSDTPLSAVFSVVEQTTPAPSKRRSSRSKTAAEIAPAVINLPADALIGRGDGHMVLLERPVKIYKPNEEITLTVTDLARLEEALAKGLVPRVYIWNSKYGKWVALASYPGTGGTVRAVNDGEYTGWVSVFAVRQPSFSDLENQDRYEPVLNRANGLALLEGFPADPSAPESLDRVALPKEQMTRAEFVVMVTRALGLVGEDEQKMYDVLQPVSAPYVGAVLRERFADADEIQTWSRWAIASSLNSGLLDGVGELDHGFGGSVPVTRIQAGVIISNALAKVPEFNGEAADLSGFKDADLIPSWAAGKVVQGVLTGNPDGSLGPHEPVSRAEAYTMFLHLLRERGW